MGPQHLVFQKWCNLYIRKYRYSSGSNAVLLALLTSPASQPPPPAPLLSPVPSHLPSFPPYPYWVLKWALLLSDPSPSVLETPSPSPLPKMGEVQGVLKVRDRKSKMPAAGNHQPESRLPSGGALDEKSEGPRPPLPHPGAGVRPHRSSGFRRARSKGWEAGKVQLILDPHG